MSAVAARPRPERELGAWSPTDTGEPFGEWEIPGMGEPAKGCGNVMALEFCDQWEGWTPENDQRKHITYGKHLGGRRECPRCWNGQWAAPRTASVAVRLAAARRAEPTGLDRRIVHGVVSPPEDSINTIEAFYRGRRRANELAKEHGIRGGVVVAHGYRALPETKEAHREAGPGVALWKWIRENETPWREQVYWSPHYHVIGLCRDFQEGDTDRDGGWVVQNFSTGEGVRPNPAVDRTYSRFPDAVGGEAARESIEEMVKTVRYLLSHATYPAGEDRQAVTWFGALHSTNFDPEECLSAGVFATIERVALEIVGCEPDNGEEGNGLPECDVDGCGGKMHPIHTWPYFSREGHGAADGLPGGEIAAAYADFLEGGEPPPEGEDRQHQPDRRQVVVRLVRECEDRERPAYRNDVVDLAVGEGYTEHLVEHELDKLQQQGAIYAEGGGVRVA